MDHNCIEKAGGTKRMGIVRRAEKNKRQTEVRKLLKPISLRHCHCYSDNSILYLRRLHHNEKTAISFTQ